MLPRAGIQALEQEVGGVEIANIERIHGDRGPGQIVDQYISALLHYVVCRQIGEVNDAGEVREIEHLVGCEVEDSVGAVPVPENERVEPATTDEHIVAFATEEHVIVALALKGVVTAAAEDLVVVAAAEEHVVASAAIEGVIAAKVI